VHSAQAQGQLVRHESLGQTGAGFGFWQAGMVARSHQRVLDPVSPGDERFNVADVQDGDSAVAGEGMEEDSDEDSIDADGKFFGEDCGPGSVGIRDEPRKVEVKDSRCRMFVARS